MKRLYKTPYYHELSGIQSVLEQNGISVLLKNQNPSIALGEIPFLECMPEIWVIDDAQFEQAKQLLGSIVTKPAPQGTFICPQCGEKMSTAFDTCWNCGTSLR